ncbi:MAG: hypothetical protein GXP30_08070 [Verrucomicrobia bacterium]|nr:hypothetical protein [Verrucomicrobiota bacterium]
MSRISSREKKLLFLIFALLLIFGNVLALRWWRQEMELVKKEQRQLELALIEDEALYEERSEWEDKQVWMDTAIQVFPGREAADAELLKIVASSAQGAGVRIDYSELLEPPEKNENHFARAGVSVRASGTLDQLAKWIYSFQEPKDFRSLSNIEFKYDAKNPGMVHCRFQCWEWRKRPSGQEINEVAINEK